MSAGNGKQGTGNRKSHGIDWLTLGCAIGRRFAKGADIGGDCICGIIRLLMEAGALEGMAQGTVVYIWCVRFYYIYVRRRVKTSRLHSVYTEKIQLSCKIAIRIDALDMRVETVSALLESNVQWHCAHGTQAQVLECLSVSICLSRTIGIHTQGN